MLAGIEAQDTLSESATISAIERYKELKEALADALAGDDLQAIKTAHAALEAQKVPAQTALQVLATEARKMALFNVQSSVLMAVEGSTEPTKAVDNIMAIMDSFSEPNFSL